MSKLSMCLFSCLAVFLQFSPTYTAYAGEYNTWCVYLAISPYDANILNGEYNNNEYDIMKFKYPLYVGYIYSSDLKTNNVKCFEPIAQESMLKWADKRKNGAEIVFSLMQMPSETKHLNFRPGDEDYIKGVASDLYYRYSLHVIRSCVNCVPDDNWRPVFKHQYTIDFSLTEDMAFYKLGYIMRANDAWDVLN